MSMRVEGKSSSGGGCGMLLLSQAIMLLNGALLGSAISSPSATDIKNKHEGEVAQRRIEQLQQAGYGAVIKYMDADKDADGRLSHNESMTALYFKMRGSKGKLGPFTDEELHTAAQSAQRARVHVPKLADDFMATLKVLGYVEPAASKSKYRSGEG